ncbi:MAG TPA: hypothetical protein VF456_25460 [Vicinamibacterales bacterium]
MSAQTSWGGIRWIRVIVAGILLEFALVAVLLPIGAIFGAPPGLGANQTGSYTVFLTAVPVACFILGCVAGWIVVRSVSAHYVAHGFLVGTVATTFYLVMTSLNPQGGLPAAIAGYGAIHFWATQILRIAGCTLGAASTRKDRSEQNVNRATTHS